MLQRRWLVVMLTLVAIGFPVAAVAGDVNVGISIGVPAPPPIVMTAPPAVVIVPRTPVYHAPSTSFTLFVYGGRYYTVHSGAWFFAMSHEGPWVFIATEHVPQPVVAVPAAYYKVKPGHGKKHGNHSGAHASAAGGCPPGHAKQGRC